MPALAGFGAACRIARQEATRFEPIQILRDRLVSEIKRICAECGREGDLVFFGDDAHRIGNTALFAVRGLEAQTALIAFDLEGIAVSAGSACSAGRIGESHVLAAMGVPDELARCALRVSLGWHNKSADIDAFCRAFEKIVRKADKADIGQTGMGQADMTERAASETGRTDSTRRTHSDDAQTAKRTQIGAIA